MPPRKTKPGNIRNRSLVVGKNILTTKVHFIYNEDFAKKALRKTFLAKCPGWEEFKLERARVNKSVIRSTNTSYSVECPEPVLSNLQEQHLFRKMNVLFYLAERYRQKWLQLRQTKHRLLVKRCLIHAYSLRRFLAAINNGLIRSAIRLFRKDDAGYRSVCVKSEAGLTMLVAIEKFNYAKGIKFSTYFTKSLAWNLSREWSRSLRRYKREKNNLSIPENESNIILLNLCVQSDATVYDAAEELLAARKVLLENLHVIPPRSRLLLIERYGIGMDKKTDQEITEKYKITRRNLYSLVNLAISKLQKHLHGRHEFTF